MALLMTIAIQATAMTYSQAQREALFLTDKMAYELGLSPQQFAAVYEINLDYLLSVNYQSDVFGIYWERRNRDLQYVLSPYQYDVYMGAYYFYRPIEWAGTNWSFRVYSYYNDRNYFYYDRPTGWDTYRGGNNRMRNDYYAHRNYNKPSGPVGHNWRDGATGNVNNSWRNPGGQPPHPGQPHPGAQPPRGNGYQPSTPPSHTHGGHGNSQPQHNRPSGTSNHGNANTGGSWRQGQGNGNVQPNTRDTQRGSTRSQQDNSQGSKSGNFGGRR